MGKESKKKREKRHREQNLRASEKPCSNCGNPGAHFVPPSLGEKGFFTCDVETTEVTPEFKREILGELPNLSPAERYAQENFRVDGDGELCAIRKGAFNGNGLNMPVTFDSIEEAFEAGVVHQKSRMSKQIEETLADLRWAQMTLRDKLKFGLDEKQAVYRRETRCKGVLLTAINELEELIDVSEKGLTSQEQGEIEDMVVGQVCGDD